MLDVGGLDGHPIRGGESARSKVLHPHMLIDAVYAAFENIDPILVDDDIHHRRLQVLALVIQYSRGTALIGSNRESKAIWVKAANEMNE